MKPARKTGKKPRPAPAEAPPSSPPAAPPPAAPARLGAALLAAYRESPRPFAVVAVAGANLSLVHFVTLTELPSLFGSNELVALLVLSAFFLGLSAGYLVSDRLRRGHLLGLAGATLALHTTLPFSARWFAAVTWRFNLQGILPAFVFGLVFFGITPLYAVFLPRLIDAVDDGPRDPAAGARRLVPLYATELAGGILGLLISVLLSPARMNVILALHLGGIVALVLLWVEPPRRARLARLLVPVPLIYLALFSTLDKLSLEHFYKHRKGFRDVELIASEVSPYQRVDIFDGIWKEGRSRYLYLNGNLLYGTRALSQHNLLVSILPNLLVPHRSNALVIAGGSLDAARYLAPRVGHLRVVEIDETVVRLAREHIQGPRGGFPGQGWDLVIDDGKHFLGTWDGPAFDVISVDIPVPTYLQTAMLHSDRFFALARTKLAPGGVFSISLSGSYAPADPDDLLPDNLPQRVMAGLLKNFRNVTVVMADDHAFAWASDAPPAFNLGTIRDTMLDFLRAADARETFGQAPRITLLEDSDARRRAAGFEPIGEADMQIVLRLSISKLYERFYEPNPNR